MNEIFSSLVFDVKFDRSKKLSVDIGKEEKKECEGSVVGVGLLLACLDMRDDRRAEKQLSVLNYYARDKFTRYLVDLCRGSLSLVQASQHSLAVRRDCRAC